MDLELENSENVSVEELSLMCLAKTGALIQCACKMGAIMADASADDAERIYQYGVDLGVAFQLQDDWLDVYGDPATFGKEIGGDIMNNKKTFMLINAMNRATGADRDELMHWLAAENPDRKEKVAALTAIYSRLGISELAIEAMNRYNDRALSVLNSINIPEEARQAFRDFANMLMHRDR